ncbi:uncharacterized protein PV09_08638 [Verruconis gallopava]|uniref:Uncharacterized protein n=1 Tax=Verruconis gallopava TaxID=253628 RepID=A0A0D1ZZ48_9PEZI|nr:uncharacterized protein PV09_08638 [Verruconis gallopava]KIV99707.1 hypothetical protein PV09_08638 [Verruconis gallopava]
MLGWLNTFIPFADPTRPIWRDVALSTILLLLMYVAPRIDFDALVRKRSADKEPAVNVSRPDTRTENLELDVNEFEDQHEDSRNDPADESDAVELQADSNEVHLGEHRQMDDANDEGPVRHQPRARNTNREVGSKKAKSIARRNQQRAYNEWLREQGDAQRAEWARDEHERQAELAAEKQRRAAIDARLREKEKSEREARRAKEEVERQAELEATQKALCLIEQALEEKKCSNVNDVAKSVKRSEEWVRQLARREGLLGVKLINDEKTVVMLTSSGWIMRVDKTRMDKVYAQAAAACSRGDGRITWSELGRMLQRQVVDAT